MRLILTLILLVRLFGGGGYYMGPGVGYYGGGGISLILLIGFFFAAWERSKLALAVRPASLTVFSRQLQRDELC